MLWPRGVLNVHQATHIPGQVLVRGLPLNIDSKLILRDPGLVSKRGRSNSWLIHQGWCAKLRSYKKLLYSKILFDFIVKLS